LKEKCSGSEKNPRYPMDKPSSKQFRCHLLIIWAVALGYYLTYFRHGLVQLDEGVIFDSAERIMRGEEWAVDFLAHYGLVKSWLLAKLFAVTGVRIETERLLFIFMRLPALAVFYAIGLRIMPSRWSLCTTLAAALVPGHHFKIVVLLLIVVHIWLAFRWWETFHKRWAFALGFWATFSFWSRLENVHWLLLTGGLSLLAGLRLKSAARKQWAVHLGAFIAGAPAGIGILMPFFPGMKNYMLWVYRWIETSMRTEPIYRVPWPSPAALFSNPDTAATFLSLWAVLLTYVAAAVLLAITAKKAGRDPSWFYRIVLTLTGAAMLFTVFIISNLAHLLQFCSPAYLLFASIAYTAFSRLRNKPGKALVGGAFGVPAAAFLVYSVLLTHQPGVGSISLLWLAATPVKSRIGTVYATDPPGTPIQQVVNYIKENPRPKDTLFCYPGCGIINTMTGTRNPTMLNYHLPNFSYVFGPGLSDKIRRQVLDAEYFVYRPCAPGTPP